MNCRQEFMALIEARHTEGAHLHAATIAREALTDPEPRPIADLPCNHTSANLTDFFDALDFTYDEGYGTQEIYGTIWFTDGTWATRAEYDGSEWWEVHQMPPIPERLLSQEVPQ